MDFSPSTQPDSHYEYTAGCDKNGSVKEQAFGFIKNLHGWCTVEKADLLMDIIFKTKPDTIVEIGVFGGKSLIPMACALKFNKKGVIYGIDPWSVEASTEGMLEEAHKKWWSRVDHEAILRELVDNLSQFALGNEVILVRAASIEAPPIHNIDILHIDGNHSDEPSYIDVTKWVPLMKSGGWIIFDDMTWIENGIYTQGRAVEWLNKNCIKIAEFKDPNEIWGIWRKP